MADVSVHYNSPQPARIQALAFTRGTDIHLAPGQERHLPHESWHVVQQKSGQVNPTVHIGGIPINDDTRMEQQAETMGRRAAGLALPAHGTTSPQTPQPRPARQASQLARWGAIQRVKQPPVGNFPRYVTANVSNSGVTAGVHPNDAEVAAEGDFTHPSAPANSYGWAALQPNAYALGGGVGGGANTTINVDPMVDHNGNHLYRMHLIHHRLGANTNGNINNIVLGPGVFNRFHVNHVENFMGDSMAHNFYYTSGGSLHTGLVVGEAIGIAPAAHANAGTPYVVGVAPAFPAGLRTGVILAANNGVPHNAWEIRTDELGLDRFVCLWYYVRPVFGLASAAVYANLFAHLNTEYANRPGAIQHWENIPPGILGAGGMLQNMADAIAGIYATALVVRGSFFTPEPEAIPAGGSTADLLPWRDNRIPERTLGNAALNPFVRIVMNYDNGMVMANTAPAILQL